MSSDTQTIAALQEEVANLRQQLATSKENCNRERELNGVLLEATDMLVVILDVQGYVVRFNRACQEVTGFHSDEVVGSYVWDFLIPPEQIEGVKGVFQSLALDQMPNRYENEWMTRDGNRRLLSWSNTLLRNQSGELLYIVGTAQDITECRKFEERLHQQESLLQGLVQNSPTPIFVKNTKGEMILVNAKLEQFLQVEPGTLIGKTVHDIFPPEVADKVWQSELEILQSGEGRTVEESAFAQGELRTLITSKFPVLDNQGNPYAVGGILTDITDRKEIEVELQTIHDRYQSLWENAPIGIFQTTFADGQFVDINPALAHMFGYMDPEEMMRSVKSRDLYASHKDRELLLEALQKEGKSTGTQVRFRHRDGHEIIGNFNIWLLHDEDGKPHVLEGFLEDITERKQAEEEQELLQQQVIDAQQAAIRELSTPLIPLSEHVVLMPLIGNVDTQRAQLVMETLLEGIAQYQVDTAILDITGVMVVDTQVAHAIIQAAQAVKLLGAQVILTGIGPTMAQTLIHLGADLSSIKTSGRLQQAILDALKQ